MKYYVTIYIDELLEIEIINSLFQKQGLDFTHAFLGLTKGKSPDELDTIDNERRQEKLNNKDWKDCDKRWYESLDTNEYNDGFWGFGTGTDSIRKTAGKVFKNNHFVSDNNTQSNRYELKKLRSKQTFSSNNRCILEISQEQYETLLQYIKNDYEATKNILPNTQEAISENFRYDILSNNCVHWVQKQLRVIGVEVVSESDSPGFFMDIFDSIQWVHSIFLQFQTIDSNLTSIKGAKAFHKWARMMIDNIYCFALKFDNERNTRVLNNKKESPDAPFEIVLWKSNAYKLMQVYRMLQEKLNTLKSKQMDLRGKFIFTYNDKENGDRKIFIDPSSGYIEQDLEYLDLTIPANNFSVNEFYPFIFIPDNKMTTRILYHEYDYATLSPNYTKDMMDFYYAFLEGREIQEYWSEAFHTINKRVQDEYRFA